MTHRRSFLQACGLATVLALGAIGGCGADAISGQSAYVIQTDVTAEGGFLATLPNGKVFTDPTVFMDQALDYIKQAQAQGQDIQIQLGPTASAEIAGAYGTQTGDQTTAQGDVGQHQSALYQQIGSVVITGGWDTGYLSGCIKQNVYKYAFRGNDKFTGVQYFDLHIAFWRQGTTLCIGLYESVFRLVNKCSCDPDEKDRIYQELFDIIRRAKVAAAVTAAVTAVLTTVMVGIFALA